MKIPEVSDLILMRAKIALEIGGREQCSSIVHIPCRVAEVVPGADKIPTILFVEMVQGAGEAWITLDQVAATSFAVEART